MIEYRKRQRQSRNLIVMNTPSNFFMDWNWKTSASA
jgi:hypothetical protein